MKEILETLSLIFIVLKLCGLINWSWWWVMSPLYPPILALLIFLWFYPKSRKDLFRELLRAFK